MKKRRPAYITKQGFRNTIAAYLPEFIPNDSFIPIFEDFFFKPYFDIDFSFIFCFPVVNLSKVTKGEPCCYEKLSKRIVVRGAIQAGFYQYNAPGDGMFAGEWDHGRLDPGQRHAYYGIGLYQ